MHLRSTLDSFSKSEGNVPVAIFSLGEQSKLLRVHDGYQDMLKLVAESFHLEEDVLLSLRTSTIDVFRGKEVEIDESAYVYARPCLGQVDVSIVEPPPQVSRCQQKRAQEKSRAISPIAEEHSSNSLRDGFEPEGFSMVSNTVIHSEVSLDKQPLAVTLTPDVIGKGIGRPSKADDTIPWKVESKFEKRANVEHTNQPEVPQEKAFPLKAADLQPIAEPEDNGPGGPHSTKKFRPAGVLFPKSNKEIGSPVRVKREILAEPANAEPAKLDTPAAQPEEDPRFEITIISPQNETAQFKTRGKHPVRKVLAAACKTFDIKYERARLILSVSTEEGGQIQTDEFDCPAEETMSQCGVDGNAKLFVRIEPDPDDEEYDED